jgi:hypothetical protein
MARNIEITLDGVRFQIDYVPSSDMMEYTTIRKADFMFTLLDDEEGENILKDKDKALDWVKISMEKLLLDHLLLEDYKQIYTMMKVNPLNIDSAFYTFEWRYFNFDDDQRVEVESNKVVGNTVNGRKYIEKMRNS